MAMRSLALGVGFFWVMGLASTGRSEQASPRAERELISLEARTQLVERTVQRDTAHTVQSHLRRARRAWRDDIPMAAALYNIVLGYLPSGNRRVQVLIDAARAEAAFGNHSASLQHFNEALSSARQGHQVASAFEGFVDVATRAAQIPLLPDVDRYVAAVSHQGFLDDASQEAIYRLARLLVRNKDPRADEVLAYISEGSLPSRRAAYMRGVLFLGRGQIKEATNQFNAAARQAPHPYLEYHDEILRDAHVRELSWLAVGRLAFEANDMVEGIYAHQQIPPDSPRFQEAAFELGWMAMDAGEEHTALLAFQPLIDLDPDHPLSRKALLVEGLVMLQRGQHLAALRHYEEVSLMFTSTLKQFDERVQGIGNLADLARDCDVRARALADPLLAPILERPDAKAAEQLTMHLEELHALGFAIGRQVDSLDRILAGDGAGNPFRELQEDRKAVLQVLEDLQESNLSLDSFRIQRRRVAGPAAVASEPCCTEPRLRSAHLRKKLEKMLGKIEHRERELRLQLGTMRDEMSALLHGQEAALAELEPGIRDTQREAVAAAVALERESIRRMLVEGDAGALEAIWQYKERHRDRIAHLERRRREILDALLSTWSEKLADVFNDE